MTRKIAALGCIAAAISGAPSSVKHELREARNTTATVGGWVCSCQRQIEIAAWSKFNPPTVVRGRVFVPSTGPSGANQ